MALLQHHHHVQHGSRYAVIVQADELLALSTAVVCPTSRSTPAASFHPEVVLDEQPTRVLCEMVGAVDISRLGDRVAHLALDELIAIDDALGLVLGLA
jgi:mRNA interferase MazF